jgi:hypothetical protein
VVSGCKRTLVERVDIVDVEDHASPPAPTPLRGLGDKVQTAAPGSEAGEWRCFSAVHSIDGRSGRPAACRGSPACALSDEEQGCQHQPSHRADDSLQSGECTNGCITGSDQSSQGCAC